MAKGSSRETNGFGEHCQQIVRGFLLTAVVVDDELSAHGDRQVHSNLTPGDPRAPRPAPTRTHLTEHPSRPLEVDPITWSFARQGMVCGVVAPQDGQNDIEVLAKAVARADIVILDWQLSRRTGQTALPLLERVLRADQPDRLRLIAFYTGEPDQQDVRGQITDTLNALEELHRTVGTTGDHGPIDFGACRIVVYGKPGSSAPDLSTVVKEEELADRLIVDLAEMVHGLLPSLVLTALAAVRENVYRVLKRFGQDLDPAFLAHRACLPQPSESEEHMVEQIASELHGIMDEAVNRENPAGIAAIDSWLADRFEDGRVEFQPKGQGPLRVRVGEVLQMLESGFDNHRPSGLGRKQWPVLSHGLAGDSSASGELDHRLASAMSFRQVLEGSSRQLSMGTVVRQVGAEETTLLCVTPKCDSVRLTGKSSFLFLPLSEPKSNTLQIVVPDDQGKYRRMTVSDRPTEWLIRHFTPGPGDQCVLAKGDESERAFIFRESGDRDGSGEGDESGDGESSDREYRWVGELKPELAQSIAQKVAKRMSRIPLNKSEWLRRSEGTGKRAS